jgi:voltage-gated potassium channel Kch
MNDKFRGKISENRELVNVSLGNLTIDGRKEDISELNGFTLKDSNIKKSIFKYIKFNNLKIIKNEFYTESSFFKCEIEKSLLNRINTDFRAMIGYGSGFPIGKGFSIRHSKIKNSKIEDCNLEDFLLFNSEIVDSTLSKNTFFDCRFQRSNFNKVGFKQSIFEKILFNKCNINNCEFKDTTFIHVEFIDCLLENVYFNGINFENINFNKSALYNINWGKTTLKREFFTNLKPKSEKIYFRNEISGWIKESKIMDYEGLYETYLIIKNNFRLNGRYSDESWAYLNEKKQKRLSYFQKIREQPFYFKSVEPINILLYRNFLSLVRRIKYFFQWIYEVSKFVLFGHGEKPQFLLVWSAIIITIFSLVFYYTNSISSSIFESTKINFINCLYFSSITFTTLGLGDFVPIQILSRAMVTVEAFLGLLFYSLFIFSIGRRIAGR